MKIPVYKMKMPIYVLHGIWNDGHEEYYGVIEVSFDIEPLKRVLGWIADSNAIDFVTLYEGIKSKRSDMSYYVIDSGWRYAKFRISKHEIRMTEMVMRQVIQEMKKIQKNGFEATGEEPDVDITSDGLVGKFLEAKENWKKDVD